jgi:hypothetical protein
MTSYFERLIDFVGAHPQLSFLAVFLLALSEAVPVIGTVVPGSTLILAISALATAAGITPWALLARGLRTAATPQQGIRERAYQIWLEEGCPEGRELDHWDMATKLVAIEDGQQSTLKPIDQKLGPAGKATEIEAYATPVNFPVHIDVGLRPAGAT